MGGKRRSFEGNEAAKFANLGPRQSAIQTNPLTLASNILAIAAETVAFSAGAAGTTGIVSLDKAPVFDSYGSRIAAKGATSFSWITGTILLREVEYDDDLNDTDMLAALTENGDYAIDYVMGRIYYKKATAGTSDTCNYNTRQLNIEITGAADIEIGAVELKNGATDDRALISDANTARAATDHVLAVQHIDAAGNVLGIDAANTARTTATKVLPGQIVDAAGLVEAVAVHDAAAVANGKQQMLESKDFDGAALPNPAGAEGDAVRQAGSLTGVAYTMEVNEDGSKTPQSVDHAAAVASPVAKMIVGVYRLAADTYDDGDAVVPHFTAAGKLMVDASMAATDYADDASFQIATDNVMASGFLADETAPDSVDEGDIGIARMTLERKLHSANTEAHDAAASPYAGMVGFESKTFDGAALPNPVGAEADIVRGAASLSGVQYVMPVNQDGSKSPIQVEDAAHTTGDVGFAILAVQKTANAALADDGDYANLQLSQNGYLKVTVNAIRDAAVAIGSGAMDGGTQRVNLASDDPLVAKTPALGTALMAASSPTTLATDDTQFGAVGAAADPDGNIHGQLRSIAEEAAARNAGGTLYFDSDGDNTAQALKAGAGKLFKLHVYNPNAVAAFVQLFDLAAAGVTVGVTAPSFVVFVPAQGAVTEEFGAVAAAFATAITYACTLTPTGAGDPTTGLTVSAVYK